MTQPAHTFKIGNRIRHKHFPTDKGVVAELVGARNLGIRWDPGVLERRPKIGDLLELTAVEICAPSVGDHVQAGGKLGVVAGYEDDRVLITLPFSVEEWEWKSPSTGS